MTRRFAYIAIILLYGHAISNAAPPELVDSLVYQSWQPCKPGTKLVTRYEVIIRNQTVVQQITYTLTAITPEKATLDVAVMSVINGIKQERKATQEVKARIDPAEQYLPAGIKGSAKQVDTQEIAIGDKKFQCKVYEFVGEGVQGIAAGKSWMSIDVPGGIVKSEMMVQKTVTATLKTTVLSMDIKQ